MNRSKAKWSITRNVIWPLACFGVGLMIGGTMTGGMVHEAASTAPSTQTRLVELMGEVNDLENTVSDLRLKLRAQQDSYAGCQRELSESKQALGSALAREREANAGEAVTAKNDCNCDCGTHGEMKEDWDKEVAEEAAWAAKLGKSSGKAAEWSSMGKWRVTDLEPLSFSRKYDIGLPIDTIKWSGGHLLMPKGKGGQENSGTALDHIQQSCKELDVLVLNDNHCVALTTVKGGHDTPYQIQRFLKGGYTYAKKQSNEFALVSRLTTPAGRNEGSPPGKHATQTHRRAITRFLNSVETVEAELKPLLTKHAKNNVIVTMTMNAGMTDLILNFVCSAKRAGKSIDNLVLFPTDDEAIEVAKSLGLAYYSHKSFGDFPKEEAGSYGDDTFTKMMWIKVLCVYLPISLGYDVLFQDADVVWLQDPVAGYFDKPELSGDFDVYFQDDGARSTRFGPYFSNSGFYFLRNNLRTKYFMKQLLYSGDLIIEWHSHQSALTQMLADASSTVGLKVKTLSYVDFPSGKDYHHRKPYMRDWLEGRENPYVFHMCWTANKVDKIKYLKQLGGWFLDRSCHEDSIRTPAFLAQASATAGGLQGACCSAEPVLDCFFKDKPSKESCEDSPSKDRGRPSWW